jgi:glycosyltransferase involved in cell wall biosynthesis
LVVIVSGALRIVVDVTPFAARRTGVGNYWIGMLRGLAEVSGDEHEIVAFAVAGPRAKQRIQRELGSLPLTHRLVTVPPPSPTWHRLWSRLGRPPVEWLAGALDVFHFSDWLYPAQRAGIRATTVHDLVPLRFPHLVPAGTLRTHVPKHRHAAHTCDLLFANSRFTAGEVTELLGVSEARVRVAYPPLDRRYTQEGERAEFRGPYLLAVATLEPRKNLPTLIEAFKLVRQRRPELSLAVAGAEGWGERPDLSSEGVKWLGYVPDEELPALYRGAELLCYPSLFEGFGMPIVEAMACGTPVVASAHPSLDEASAEIALRADPHSAESFAEQIERALDARDELRAPGLEHARRFSPEACARAVLDGYRSAA